MILTTVSQLIIMRHGIAELPFHGRTDFQRKLTTQGRFQVLKQSQFLHKQGLKPSVILASSALRCAQTASIVSQQFPNSQMVLLESFYMASAQHLSDVLRQQQSHGVVILIGHNPGLTQLIKLLSETDKVEQLQPADAVLLEWSEHGMRLKHHQAHTQFHHRAEH